MNENNITNINATADGQPVIVLDGKGVAAIAAVYIINDRDGRVIEYCAFLCNIIAVVKSAYARAECDCKAVSGDINIMLSRACFVRAVGKHIFADFDKLAVAVEYQYLAVSEIIFAGVDFTNRIGFVGIKNDVFAVCGTIGAVDGEGERVVIIVGTDGDSADCRGCEHRRH